MDKTDIIPGVFKLWFTETNFPWYLRVFWGSHDFSWVLVMVPQRKFFSCCVSGHISQFPGYLDPTVVTGSCIWLMAFLRLMLQLIMGFISSTFFPVSSRAWVRPLPISVADWLESRLRLWIRVYSIFMDSQKDITTEIVEFSLFRT